MCSNIGGVYSTNLITDYKKIDELVDGQMYEGYSTPTGKVKRMYWRSSINLFFDPIARVHANHKDSTGSRNSAFLPTNKLGE